MRKIVLVVTSLIIATSCTNSTLESRLKEAVENYLDNMVKEELKNKPDEDSYLLIDSLIVKDEVTTKDKLGYELLDLKKKAEAIIKDGKELKEEYQSTKDLLAMYNADIYTKDAYSVAMQNDLNKIKQRFEEKSKASDVITKQINEKLQERSIADSVDVLYYYVFAYVTVVDKKRGVKKNHTAPFHVSKDMLILKTPRELLGLD